MLLLQKEVRGTYYKRQSLLSVLCQRNGKGGKQMTNNKQQTAVEWLQSIELERDLTLADWALAKEMESRQSHRYATFCLRCANENLPIIRFKDWIDLEGDKQ
jgi:hypothetical protein